MGLLSVLSFVHHMVKLKLRPGDIAVDATVGTGADTRFLCEQVGPRGTVYGFDIQQEALDRATARFNGDSPPQLHLLLADHAQMTAHMPDAYRDQVTAIMFNLGYLPGGDPNVITRPDSTIAALEAAMVLLRPGGLITATLYPGHPGGDEEARSVQHYLENLPHTHWQVASYRFTNRDKPIPYALFVEKKPTQE